MAATTEQLLLQLIRLAGLSSTCVARRTSSSKRRAGGIARSRKHPRKGAAFTRPTGYDDALDSAHLGVHLLVSR